MFGERVSAKREITGYKKKVVEQVVYWESDSSRKLIWTLDPFDKMEVDGLKNPCFHANFSGGESAERIAREQVRTAFEPLAHGH